MPTAVDSSVLLDVLLDDPMYAERSEAALRKASKDGGLIISDVVIAELVPVLGNASIHAFLSDWGIQFTPSSVEIAALAGSMFKVYLERGGKRGRVVPDFLIAAHAQIHVGALLARDRGSYRDYFDKLTLIDPAK